MGILTRGQFETIARSKVGVKGLGGIVNESRRFSKSTSSTSIFLSHSHLDRALVEQAKIFFENLGISIYVDWADETMPENTNGITAQKIKSKIINDNDKFVLLATNNALASKWCNWEVGIADPFKLPRKKIALLPLAENSGSWNGNEYLQIYPRIEKGTADSNVYYIWYPGERFPETLENWLKR